MKIFITIILAGLLSTSSRACICSDILTIDSLPQLKDYEFIAHVKITDDQDLKKPAKDDYESIGILTFHIIELFKGQKIDKILEYSKHSSCDIGISTGEEWILFGKIINGRLAVVSCDRNHQYKERNELRDWKYGSGFYELTQLRKLYHHTSETFYTGKRKEFYSNGQLEIEETYFEGKRNGERRIWYPNGILYCRQFYKNDTLDGRSEWFYPSGQIYDESLYIKGKPCNVSRLYFDSTIERGYKKVFIDESYKTEDSLDFAYKGVQAQYETVYDSYGRVIISREYTRVGKIHKEEIIDPDKKFRTVIYYHNNGIISSIMYSLNGKNYGHYQTYNENGSPGRGWDYDENGKVIKTTIQQ